MNSLIKKNWQKDASNVLVDTLLRITGAGASAYVLNKASKPEGVTDESQMTAGQKTWKNVSGPLMMGIGILGDMMFADPKLKSACQGVAVFSALKAVAVISPSIGEPIGLSGLAGNIPSINNVGAVEPVTAENWNETPALPAETTSDGNNWAEVAEYVNEGAEEAVETTAGIEQAAMKMSLN